MTVLLLVLLGLAVVAVVAVLIVRDEPLLADDPVDARALRWPLSDPVAAPDLDLVRFTVAVRGYRMDEVDQVLDDLRGALAQRDDQIAELLAERCPEGVLPLPPERSPEGVLPLPPERSPEAVLPEQPQG